jgi:hypothetical protein
VADHTAPAVKRLSEEVIARYWPAEALEGAPRTREVVTRDITIGQA